MTQCFNMILSHKPQLFSGSAPNTCTNYHSVLSRVGQLSCNRTALKHCCCTSTETRWNRRLPRPLSPEIFLPSFAKSWQSDTFRVGFFVALMIPFQ